MDVVALGNSKIRKWENTGNYIDLYLLPEQMLKC